MGNFKEKRASDSSQRRRASSPYLTPDRLGRGRGRSELVSTRDLDVNWEAWEEHVFFGSAKARLQSSAHYIRSTFPFDGSQEDLNGWFSELSGWQEHLLRNVWIDHRRSAWFPEGDDTISPTTDPNKPFDVPAVYTVDFEALKRSKSEGAIGVLPEDEFGASSPLDISRARLNPGPDAFCVEFWFKAGVPVSDDLSASNSITNSSASLEMGLRGVATHRNIDGEGWTILADYTSDGVQFVAHLGINVGAPSFAGDIPPQTNIPEYLQSSARTERFFKMDEWHHVNITWGTAAEGRPLRIVVNGEEQELINVEDSTLQGDGRWVSENVDAHWIGWTPSPQMDVAGNPVPGLEVQRTGGFLIDEYRLWHTAPNLRNIQKNRFKNVWAQDALVLQYRFNDAPETRLNFNGQALLGLLDSSGNRLNGQRQPEYGLEVELPPARPKGLQERKEHHPSIYPMDSALNAVLAPLSASAGDYDEANPNLITKLVPAHMFDNPLLVPRTQIAGGDELERSENGALLLAALLYTWADFWDDLKLRGDALLSALHLNPDGSGSARALLPIIAKETGITLPIPFEDVTPEAWDEEFEAAQERVWRRVLLALPDILKRKGTVQGIRALFSSIGGLQVDGAIRFREWGNKTKRTEDAREVVEQQVRFLRTDNPPRIRFTRGNLNTKVEDNNS